MVWGINQTDYASMPVPELNPFNTALKKGLDTYQNMVKAKYAPMMNQAEIASKAAYATYSPYNQLAQIFKDPTMMAMLAQDPERFGAIMDKFKNIPTDPYTSIGGIQPSKPSPIQQMWNTVTGQGNEASQQVTPQANPQANQNITQPSNITTNQARTSGNAMPLSDQNGLRQFRTPMERDAYIKAFPNSPEALDFSSQNDLWKKSAEEGARDIDETQKGLTSLQTMESLYPKLSAAEKGTFLGIPIGKGPAFTSEAQSFDKLAKTQATTNIRALQTGHITNTDFAIADRIQPGRELNEESFKELTDFNRALLERKREKQSFMTNARKKGMRYEDANTMWSEFINKYPLFNPNTQRLIDKNSKIDPFNPKGGMDISQMNANVQANKAVTPSSTNTGGFNPIKMLDNKWKSPDEFKEAFNTLDANAKKLVLAEMQKRGWT